MHAGDVEMVHRFFSMILVVVFQLFEYFIAVNFNFDVALKFQSQIIERDF